MQQEERNKGKLSRAKIDILNGICKFPWKDDDYQFDLNVRKMYNCYFFNNKIYTDDVYEWLKVKEGLYYHHYDSDQVEAFKKYQLVNVQ